MVALLSQQKQLTYPLERCSVSVRLSNPKHRAKFLAAIMEQRGYMAACEKMGMAHGSVWSYRRKNPDFESELQAILDELYHELGFQAIRIADEARAEGNPQLSSLVANQINARLRAAQVRARKAANIEVNVDNRKQTVIFSDKERQELIAQRERALAKANNNNQLKDK